jgi:tripartite ATP-independent transporter DctM subunit
MISALIGFAAMLALSLLGVPLAYAILLVGFVGFALDRSFDAALAIASQQIMDTLLNPNLTVIPLFVLMGTMIYRSNIADELYSAANAWLGRLRGGLAMATVLACAAFSSVCGSSVATSATMCKVVLPSMRRYGYEDSLTTGTLAAGGTLGIMIPPSVPMMIYCIIASEDITEMFVAGILPGLLIVLLYLLAIVGWTALRPQDGPPGPGCGPGERLASLLKTGPVAALFAGMLGGMYFGVFTPNEAAGMGTFGAFLFAAARWGRTTPRFLMLAITDSVKITASLIAIIFCALVFTAFINRTGLPGELVTLVQDLNLTPAMLVLFISVARIILAMVFEEIGILLLIIPAFIPVLKDAGVDLIWFGVVFIVVIQIGLIMPPIGMNVFTVNSIVRDVPLSRIYLGVWAFVAADFVALLVLIFVPEVATFLPDLMRQTRS